MRLPIYDLRFTIYDLRFECSRAVGAILAQRMRSGIFGSRRKLVRKVPEEPDGIWRCLFTIYDLRFECSRAIGAVLAQRMRSGIFETGRKLVRKVPEEAAGIWRCLFTMDDMGSSAAAPRIGRTRSLLGSHHHDDRWLS